MRIFLALGLLLVFFLIGRQAAAETRRPVSEYSSGGTPAIEAILILPNGKKYEPGVFAPEVKVRLRNATADRDKNLAPTAVVIRRLLWDYRPEERVWHSARRGRIDRNSDGTFLHDTSAEGTTDLVFEAGLLRPGEEIKLSLPLTPQVFGRHDLFLSYGLLDSHTWEGETLIEEFISPKSPGKIKIGYYPSKSVAHGKRGRSAVYKPSSEPGKPGPFAVYDGVTGFEFPMISSSPKNSPLVPLAKKAGVDLLNESWWAFRNEALGAWIFVRDDGRAVGLKDGKYVELPRMDVRVPDELGALEGGATRLRMRRDAFYGLYEGLPADEADAGAVKLPANMLWVVLARAAGEGVELKQEEVRPAGVPVRVVTAGVTAGESGEDDR